MKFAERVAIVFQHALVALTSSDKNIIKALISNALYYAEYHEIIVDLIVQHTLKVSFFRQQFIGFIFDICHNI